MNAAVSVRIALRALGANKLRSALTMLGVIIGVGAVISLMSIGAGLQQQVTESIRSLGPNLLFITPGAQEEGGVRAAAGSRPTLTLDDSEALHNAGFPFLVDVAAQQDSGGQLIAGDRNWRSRISGVTPSFQYVRNSPVKFGEFINEQHMQSRSRVMVIGSNVAQELFGDSDPVGETIRANRQIFRVIGVLESKGTSGFGQNQDDAVYMPLTTMQQRFNRFRGRGGATSVSTIVIQLTEEEVVDAAVPEIAALLRERHDVAQDDFTILSQQDLLESVGQITTGITLFLGAVAGISLLVGGIGIMNIMLVSVTERTREIGIRKALGAKRSDILMQFLIEATVVSLLGGGVGVAIGIGGSRLINARVVVPRIGRVPANNPSRRSSHGTRSSWLSWSRRLSVCSLGCIPRCAPPASIRLRRCATSNPVGRSAALTSGRTRRHVSFQVQVPHLGHHRRRPRPRLGGLRLCPPHVVGGAISR